MLPLNLKAHLLPATNESSDFDQDSTPLVMTDGNSTWTQIAAAESQKQGREITAQDLMLWNGAVGSPTDSPAAGTLFAGDPTLRMTRALMATDDAASLAQTPHGLLSQKGLHQSQVQRTRRRHGGKRRPV